MLENDPLLTSAEVAALLGVKPKSWRGAVQQGYAPEPDDKDDADGRPPNRRVLRWRKSTVARYMQTRPRGPRRKREAEPDE